MVKKRIFGEFLECLLNLELKTHEIRKFLDKCNGIIPIENLKKCKALIVLPQELLEIKRIYSKLPIREKVKDGEFYRDEEEGGLRIKYNTDYNTRIDSITMDGLDHVLKMLFEDIESLKTKSKSLIESMATYSSLSELSENSTLRSLAGHYPPSALQITKTSIEKKPRGSKFWDLGVKYLQQCASYAFFEFFLEDTNINRIRHCFICAEFFIAEDLKRQRCYSDVCRKEHERLKKQKQRGDDPVKYY